MDYVLFYIFLLFELIECENLFVDQSELNIIRDEFEGGKLNHDIAILFLVKVGDKLIKSSAFSFSFIKFSLIDRILGMCDDDEFVRFFF